MTQIRAGDIDFNKGYLHVQATNAKFKKPRTVVLLPLVAKTMAKQLFGRSKGWLFPKAIEKDMSPHVKSKISSIIATRTGLQEVKRLDKVGKNRHRVHPDLLRHRFAVWSLDGWRASG